MSVVLATNLANAEPQYSTTALSAYSGTVENSMEREIPLGDAVIQRSIVSVEGRKGVEHHHIQLTPPSPKYHHVIFVGGKGDLKCHPGSEEATKGMGTGINFVLRTRLDYAANGGNVVMFCAPSDRWGEKTNRNWLTGRGKNNDYRVSSEFEEDFRLLAAYLKQQHDLPIVVNGTSSGARAAAWLAMKTPELVDLLIMSAPALKGHEWEPVNFLEGGAETINQPTLVLVNKSDRCDKTPPKHAKQFHDMIASESKSFVEFDSNEKHPGKFGEACRPLSQHGFYGLETQSVSTTVAFIEDNL
ncbi:MAG: alpha/beta hydrolase [Porticoccaceae bacterium]